MLQFKISPADVIFATSAGVFLTTAFAKRIEKAVFLNDLHFKIALTGFDEFKRLALKGVVLPEKAEVSQILYWKGIQY